MKKIIFLLISLSIFLISCKSSTALIPGVSEKQKSSLYADFLSVADSFVELEKYDKAIDYYKKAMDSKDIYWTAYYKLGRCYALSKKWPEAKKVYIDLLKRDSSNINIRMSLGYIMAMGGDLKGAEEVYRVLYKEKPDNAEILANYINVLLASEKISEAEQYIVILKEKFQNDKNVSEFEKKINEYNEKNKKEDDSDKPSSEIESENKSK